MRLFLIMGFLLSSSIPADAASFSAFCWAQLNSGVYCTSIAYSGSYFGQGLICKQFAAGIGSNQSGFFRYTDIDALSLKQEEGCNYVANQPKYQCFIEERCETGGGVTSSISPIDRAVFSPAGDADLARKACIARAPSNYLGALSGASLSCLVGARAVMTIPKN